MIPEIEFVQHKRCAITFKNSFDVILPKYFSLILPKVVHDVTMKEDYN